MSLQSPSASEHARSLLFPRKPGPRPRVAEVPRGETSIPVQPGRARASSRRGLLTALTGGALGSPPQPERAPRRDPLLTLVHRITQGFSQAEYERARTLGYEAYLEEQLDHLSIDDSAMDARLTRFPTLSLSPKELHDAYIDDFTAPYYQMKGATLLRSIHSRRQLFERMCEFWNDHFCIDQNKGDLEWVFLPEHDRTVIRAHALGSFPAMLSACAHGAAMLFYLDNWLNVAGAPQENYARELLELHTLGVYGGYNESDVREVAKCFTGWTLNPDASSPSWLRAFFDASQHSSGPKFVLGHVIPGTPHAVGQGTSTMHKEAQQVLDIVAAHPSTADFLARKLIRWFLTPTPPQALVDQVAATYLTTHGDIKAMLRVILARQNMLWTSPVLGPKFRRPFHLMVSLLRAFDADVEDPLESLLFYLPGMGHMPFDHVQPDGYPDTLEAWGTSLLPRWSFASALLRPSAGVTHAIPGVVMPTYPVMKARLDLADESDRAGLARRMNERLLGSTLNAYEEEELQQFISSYAGTFDLHALSDTLTLAASLPGFQWY